MFLCTDLLRVYVLDNYQLNLGHLKEGNSEFSPRSDNGSGTK